MKISVLGLGYVGSVSAMCLANKGYNVIGVDKNKQKVNMFKKGKLPIIEPDLLELTAKAIENNSFIATTDTEEAVLNTDISFICVGTPSNHDHSINLQYVENVCREIGISLKQKKDFHTVICRSTLFPGSINNVVIPTLEKYSGKVAGVDFSVCLNPEFLKEGTAVYDFYNPTQNIVAGTDAYGKSILEKINYSYSNIKTTFVEIEQAEILKYSYNIWHALKVCYANEIGNFCKKLGIDSHVIMNIFCQDDKLNISPHYLKPGFSFGGSCLPKDLRAFLYEAKNLQLETPVINAIFPSNKMQIENAVKLITEQGNRDIGILGLSFKADTDDLRESPIIDLIERLIGKGYNLFLYDKNVIESKRGDETKEHYLNHMPHIEKLILSSIDEVLSKSKTIVVANHNKEFSAILHQLKSDQTVVDLVRIQENPPASEQYKGICW